MKVPEGAKAESVPRARGRVHVAVHGHRPPSAAPARLECLADLKVMETHNTIFKKVNLALQTAL